MIDDDFMFDLTSRRAVFALDSVIWALHSASAAEFEALHRVYEKALFENKWGIEYTPDNEAKVMGFLSVYCKAGLVDDACGAVWARAWRGTLWLCASSCPINSMGSTTYWHLEPDRITFIPQVMGGADGMHMLGKETAESIRAWADDMDVDVSVCVLLRGWELGSACIQYY